MKLKSKLSMLMERQGIDQKTLAAKTGLSPTTVSKVYNNHFKAIDTHTVEALMRHFGLKKLDDLFEVVWESHDAS
jgi:DNA-binding Xre family transcriptional regulator